MDTDTVRRAQGGDQEAFAGLVEAIAGRFLAVSHSAGEIVSQASLAEMSTFYDNGGEYDYGLGLLRAAWSAGARSVGHFGASFGYKSSAGA